MSDLTIKVCGLRDADNIRAVEALGVDLLGMIFYPGSKRYVAMPPRYLPDASKRVGVFVDEEPRRLLQTASLFGLRTVQLHGGESPEYCHDLRMRGLRVIKAFSICQQSDFTRVSRYVGAADMALFDTPTSGYGGSGRKFDWELLDHYFYELPFLLSGGLGPDDAAQLLTLRNPHLAGFDLNSRFETAPGLKDVDLLRQFLSEIKNPT